MADAGLAAHKPLEGSRTLRAGENVAVQRGVREGEVVAEHAFENSAEIGGRRQALSFPERARRQTWPISQNAAARYGAA